MATSAGTAPGSMPMSRNRLLKRLRQNIAGRSTVFREVNRCANDMLAVPGLGCGFVKGSHACIPHRQFAVVTREGALPLKLCVCKGTVKCACRCNGVLKQGSGELCSIESSIRVS